MKIINFTFFLFRSLKTEFNEEFLMKRFGGFVFSPQTNTSSFDMLNETAINQIIQAINQTNPPATNIDVHKLATLFRVYPPQATVNKFIHTKF